MLHIIWKLKTTVTNDNLQHTITVIPNCDVRKSKG